MPKGYLRLLGNDSIDAPASTVKTVNHGPRRSRTGTSAQPGNRKAWDGDIVYSIEYIIGRRCMHIGRCPAIRTGRKSNVDTHLCLSPRGSLLRSEDHGRHVGSLLYVYETKQGAEDKGLDDEVELHVAQSMISCLDFI